MSSAMRSRAARAAARAVVERHRRPARPPPCACSSGAGRTPSPRHRRARPGGRPAASRRGRATARVRDGAAPAAGRPCRRARCRRRGRASSRASSRTRDRVVGHRLGRVGGRERRRAPDAAVVERDHAQSRRRARRTVRHHAPPLSPRPMDRAVPARRRRCSPSTAACGRRARWRCPTDAHTSRNQRALETCVAPMSRVRSAQVAATGADGLQVDDPAT